MSSLLKIKILLTGFFLIGLTSLAPWWAPSAHGFSVAEEREVGEKLLHLVRSRFKLLDDPDISQYINKLGREIVETSGPQFFDYHFFVVKNRELNAFAAPAGLLVFHSGLIESVDHENELVSVIAHEVAHATSRHIAGRLEKAKKTNAATLAMMLAGIALGQGNPEMSEALITGSMAANASLGLKFSRADEEEADRLAFKWMRESNRDPAGMVDMLKEMRRIHRFRSGNLPTYLLTHPQPGTRLGYIQDLLLFSPPKTYRQPDEFAFQRFKQRVLSMTRDTGPLIAQYKGKIARAGNDETRLAMAEYGLALTLAREADFVEAEKYMRRVMTRYPEKSILRVDLGVLYYKSGRYQKASGFLKKAISEDPDLAYGSFYLAKTLQKTGDTVQAANIYRKLLTTLPDHPETYYELGMIKANQGEPGKGYYYLGMYHWLKGDTETATHNLKKAQEMLGPDDQLAGRAKEMLDRIEELKKK